MSAPSSTGTTYDGVRAADRTNDRHTATRRDLTETKASFKTTEFFVYLAA